MENFLTETQQALICLNSQNFVTRKEQLIMDEEYMTELATQAIAKPQKELS